MTIGEAAYFGLQLLTVLSWVLLLLLFFTVKIAVKAALREYDREKNAARKDAVAADEKKE
ncbi:MAG: hypothetical protein IJE29_02305 [Firmicutes bacterium]|nr:hypothetical protein [Bacillota bacterium]